MATIPNRGVYLGVTLCLVMAAPAGQASAQEPPAAHTQLCERPAANGAIASDPKQCCCAAAPRIDCCAIAPGPRKECLAEEFQLVLPLPRPAMQAILSANGALVLGRGSSVRASASSKDDRVTGAASNLGEEDTFLAADVTVGSLLSNGELHWARA